MFIVETADLASVKATLVMEKKVLRCCGNKITEASQKHKFKTVKRFCNFCTKDECSEAVFLVMCDPSMNEL